MGVPDTRYAITPDGVYLAYQVVGEGPIDVVWQYDLIFGNVEDMWETVTRRLAPRVLIVRPADPARSSRHRSFQPERPTAEP